jgi:hypothetical protein
MMPKWLHSLAAAISGKTGNPDPIDTPAIDSDFRESGEPIEPQVPAPDDNPLEELERLLREPSRGL